MLRVWAIPLIFACSVFILLFTNNCLAGIGDGQGPIRIVPKNVEPIPLELESTPQAEATPQQTIGAANVDVETAQRKARLGYFVEKKDFASIFLEQLKALARAGSSKYFIVVAVDGIKGRFIVWNSIVVFRPGEFGLGLDRFEGQDYLGIQAGNLNRLRGILKKLKFRDGPRISGMVLKIGVMADFKKFSTAIKIADIQGRFSPFQNTLLIKGSAESAADTVLANRVEGGSFREDLSPEFFKAKALSFGEILARVGIASGVVGGCILLFQALT